MAEATGQEVVDPGVRNLGDFFRGLGDIALYGVGRRVDMEFAQPTHTPDTAETAPISDTKVSPPRSDALLDVVTALSPLQIGGLVVAGVLTWKLIAGDFR